MRISFLRYKAYRDEQARLHAEWREREDARQAAIARGDSNPPPAEPDPTAEKEIGILGLLKFLMWVALGVLLAGKFVTGEWMWGRGDGAWASVRKLWPVQQRLFSERLLGTFDGGEPDRPIYIAVRVCIGSLFCSLPLCCVGCGGGVRELPCPTSRPGLTD